MCNFSKILVLSALFLLARDDAFAQTQARQPYNPAPPKTALDILRKPALDRMAVRQFFNFKGAIVDLSDRTAQQESVVEQPKTTETKTARQQPEPAKRTPNIEFWSDKREDVKVLPPDQSDGVRVNPETHPAALGLIERNRAGDNEGASMYADAYVRMVQNYFFEVRQITKHIGAAMMRAGMIDEDSLFGIDGMIDYQMALTRKEMGDPLKPTHQAAMERIKPDPSNRAEVYYFFTLNCSWCRYMAPDIERLWRLVKNDKRVKMAAFTLGETPADWMKEYRSYTDFSMPIFDGKSLAPALNVAYVPALVVVEPTGKRAYLKTGQQSFEHMYEFVRRVQGVSAALSPEEQEIVKAPIGAVERQAARGKLNNIKIVKAANKGRQKDALAKF